jgi:signal transduction histidine kinase
VLQNLLQNAVKYSPEGGPVEVAVEAWDGQVCLRVSDRGLGIPEEALPQLFERFYRAPNADSQQISGMGIGLFVVKEIVRLHGGRVWAEPQEGGGSRFTVCLPHAGLRNGAQGADVLVVGE